jgi:hypothetical protein
MLFRVGKSKLRLLDSPTVFTLNTRDFNDQFRLFVSDRKRLERAEQAAKTDDIAGFTVRTLQVVGVEKTMKNSFAVKKTVFVYCTARTPKV